MSQHFSGRIVTQLFAEFRSLPVTISHWPGEVVLDYTHGAQVKGSM